MLPTIPGGIGLVLARLAVLLDEAVVVFVWVASAGAACAWCLTEGGVVG
jgi:hypothetical protein